MIKIYVNKIDEFPEEVLERVEKEDLLDWHLILIPESKDSEFEASKLASSLAEDGSFETYNFETGLEFYITFYE
ncbi:hypothetical protein [Paenibacillus sp. N3.4]|uniref:hypothetical protein n=1 Tax=Paenibacillus sp. N3.4 TaxID=2603222 RepID=UPI0011C78941|nr:hypothetical protein [Paenibacillus sp. N3.4]TXK83729.1 hypothetical protein FU659_12520 [Paenibacillus sp. N3.4]